jgi:hypothetical protein
MDLIATTFTKPMDWLTVTIWAVGTCGVLLALGLVAQTHEFRRFVRSRLRKPRVDAAAPRVLLFAPCKGAEAGLYENLQPLFTQNYDNYRLVLVVESHADPALRIIRQLIADHPQRQACWQVAEQATDSGQKVHNLLAATGDLADAEYLAFVDSDARPHANWLRQLVQHLDRPSIAAATGYRWFVPQSNTLANLVLHSINAGVAALVGPGKHHMLWGGAWAIRREVFQQIKLRSAWKGTLSDDLVAARQLAAHRLNIEFEPAAMTLSSVDFTWPQLWEFVRRQYVIARFYSPTWWYAALAACSLAQLGFWGSLTLTLVGIVTGAAWALPAAVVCGTQYGVFMLRSALRQSAASTFAASASRQLRAACWFDVWCSPVAGLVNWLCLVASAFGNRITWRGISYTLKPGGKVAAIERDGTILKLTTIAAKPQAAAFRKAG